MEPFERREDGIEDAHDQGRITAEEREQAMRDLHEEYAPTQPEPTQPEPKGSDDDPTS